VQGYVLWLNPVSHTEPPYYAQTSTFTCGAVTALLASEIRGSRGFGADGNNRDRELEFWRQASNFSACEPIGLAVALRRSIDDAACTAPVDVFLDTNGPALLETFPDGFDRKFREELQANSLQQALSSDITVHRDRLSIDFLATRIQAGELALLLIDTQLMYGFAVPHWVLAHSVEQGLVIIDDPTISSFWGETWVDAHEIPISLKASTAWSPGATAAIAASYSSDAPSPSSGFKAEGTPREDNPTTGEFRATLFDLFSRGEAPHALRHGKIAGEGQQPEHPVLAFRGGEADPSPPRAQRDLLSGNYSLGADINNPCRLKRPVVGTERSGLRCEWVAVRLVSSRQRLTGHSM
jgi:hypothetical protein